MSHVKPNLNKIIAQIAINKPQKIKLKDYFTDYAACAALKNLSSSKKKSQNNNEYAQVILDESRQQLESSGELLWASKKHSVLIVLQGMDTAGKDGIISHVISGFNPQSCKVHSFKVPSAEEHMHNFLWRYNNKLPQRGELVIFNRSYYEDVLVTKVHPECMEQLPYALSYEGCKKFWQHRYEDINAMEKHLARNGVLILKFFLNISKGEQKSRLLERLDNENKLWKISPSDLKERNFWNDYISAYEDMLSNTGNEYAPWVIVPANDKKVARAIVAYTIAQAINGLNLDYPKVSVDDIKQLKLDKKRLMQDKT
jgi:PPK2 family polyphosphate:nucleotide phosphotransferase